MPLYEVTFVTRQDLSRQDVDKLTETCSSVITTGGGSVVKNEYWGLRNLSYRIQKNRKGHYVMLGLDSPADAVKELERQLRINEDVIRTLTVRVEAHEEGPTAMLKGGRDESFGDEGVPGELRNEAV